MMSLSDSLDDRLEACLSALDAGRPLESVLSTLSTDERAEIEPLLQLTTAVRSLPEPVTAPHPRPDIEPTISSLRVRPQRRRWFARRSDDGGKWNFGLLFGSVYATGMAVVMIAILAGVILVPRLLSVVEQASSPENLGGLVEPTPAQTSVLIASTPGSVLELEARYGTGDAPGVAVARLGIGQLKQVAPSPDGSMLAIGTSTGVYMYDATTMRQIWSESTYTAVEEIAWTADSKRIAARLYKWPNVLVWNGKTGEYVRSLEFSGEILSMAWSPDRTQLAAGFFMPDSTGYAFGVVIWQVDTGRKIVEAVLGTESYSLPIEGDQPQHPVSLDWSPGEAFAGGPVAVTVGERSIALIDPAGGSIEKTFQGDVSGEPLRARFSPDGQWLAVYTEADTQVEIRQVSTGEIVYRLGHDALVYDLKWSDDGKYLATTTYGHIQTRVWDMTNGAMLLSITAPAQDFGVFSWFDTLTWSADGRKLIVSDQRSGEIVQWDPATGKSASMGFRMPDLADYSPVAYIGSAPDGSLVIWDSETGVPHYSYQFAPPPVQIGWSAGALPAQTQIAAVSADQSTIVWDIESAQPVEILDDPKSIDGWLVGEADPRGWGCWDTVTALNERKRLTASATSTVDANGQSSAVVDITDSHTHAALYKWTSKKSAVCALAFSSDGLWLAIGQGKQSGVTATNESAITILDMETGEVYDVFYGHTGSVAGLAWSPDGKRLASVSMDGTIVVWNVIE
ncbi:MAG: hypothetical protein JXB07_05260 [Anaerolineae bacterium]|nr:hypothetical protein [Anaerolineae bacterium]